MCLRKSEEPYAPRGGLLKATSETFQSSEAKSKKVSPDAFQLEISTVKATSEKFRDHF